MKFTNYYIITCLLCIPLPVSAQTKPDDAITHGEKLFECVRENFYKYAGYLEDKEQAFDETLVRCRSYKNRMILDLEKQKTAKADINEIANNEINKIKNISIQDYQRTIDSSFWQAAYTTVLSTCPKANIPVLSNLRNSLVEQAYRGDAFIRNQHLASMKIEYNRIRINISAQKMGHEVWCKAERAYLEKETKDFFLP